MRALYRRLRAIEASLQKSVTVPEISALEGDLEILDREIFVLGVPIRHSDLYFMIKSHLNLVRSHIGLRRSESRTEKTTPRLLR